MSDPTPIRQILGLDQVEDAEPQSAADPFATATPDAPDGDDLTIDEALAALDPTAAPQTQATPAETDADPSAALTPEQIAALVAENEQYKAREAKLTAEQEVTAFDDKWDAFMASVYDVYDAEEERIKALGAKEGRSQAEIDAAIYRRVDKGAGLTIPGTTTPMKGKDQWERETLLDYALQRSNFLVARGQQSVDPIAQLAQQYHLDESDTQALAKFRDMPREKVEELARTLGAKNQRVTNTFEQATQEANRNVARNLANATVPGVPGTPPAQKTYQFKHTPDVAQKETQYVVNRLFRRAS